MQTTPPVLIHPTNKTTATVIWLHGLGADGNDFVPVIEALNLPHIHFILPHAPYLKVTRNNGYEMRAWYDVYGLTPISREDAEGIRHSQTSIGALIDAEIARGVPANRIAIAGFSQGGAVALQTALRYAQPLAGVLALSTYLPLKNTLAAEKTAANQHTPIFLAHGSHDDVITLDFCLQSKQVLQQNAYHIDWHEYPMAHSVCLPEIADIGDFLNRILP